MGHAVSPPGRSKPVPEFVPRRILLRLIPPTADKSWPAPGKPGRRRPWLIQLSLDSTRSKGASKTRQRPWDQS